jgi:hypothetical protein
MVLPKVIFKYSRIYDEIWKERLGKKFQNYPSARKILNYIKKIEKGMAED